MVRAALASLAAVGSALATAADADSAVRPVGVVLGAAVVLIFARRAVPPVGMAAPAAARGFRLVAWLGVLGVPAAFQLASLVNHPRDAHPTVSSLLNVAFEHHPARTLGFGLWLALGCYLVSRR